MERRLFTTIELDAMRLPGVTKGQHEMLLVIHRFGNNSGSWTGPRSQLALALHCSPDTITRRKDALVERGLLSVVPSGRCLTYSLIRQAVERVTESTPTVPPPVNPSRKRVPWFKRPDANQLSLPFPAAESRAEIVQRLGANLLQTLSLVIALVVGPAGRAANRKLSENQPAATTTSAPNQPQTSVMPVETSVKTDAEQREANLVLEHLERVRAKQWAASQAKPPANQPHTIEPIPTPITISTQTNIQRPIKPTSIGDGSAKSFCLWRNATFQDFKNPVQVQEIFNRLLAAKLCTPDERLHVFKFVAHCVRTVDRSKYKLAGVITNNFRGGGLGSDKLPWRARGDESDESVARAMIRALDVEPAMQVRSGNLLEEENTTANEQSRQRTALLERERRGTA